MTKRMINESKYNTINLLKTCKSLANIKIIYQIIYKFSKLNLCQWKFYQIDTKSGYYPWKANQFLALWLLFIKPIVILAFVCLNVGNDFQVGTHLHPRVIWPSPARFTSDGADWGLCLSLALLDWLNIFPGL